MENKNISRKQALKQMGGLALGSAFFSSLPASAKNEQHSFPNVITKRASDKPNILWITGEGVPVSMLSSYLNTAGGDLRSSLVDTPNLDRLAQQGMQFNNSFCTNALCAPSRATLLTGKYNHLNGMGSNPGGTTGGHTASFFDPSQPTVAKALRRHGYQTGTVGKWHLVSEPGKPTNPGKAGFDYFAFKRGAGGPYYNPDGYLQNSSLGSTVIEEKSQEGYITDNFTDMAIQGMKQFDRPFMMMMQFFNDHRPFDPPHKYEHIYDEQRIPEPSTFWDDYNNRSSVAKEARMRVEYMPDFDPPKDLTDRQRKQWNYQKLMQHFLGTLKSQDDNIGRLLDYLDQSGLAENTIVVYTCDHGFFLGEHGWFDKRFMYEEAIRVPWIMRYPGMIEQGSKTNLMGVSIDNAPTIMDLTGLPVPDDMQGESLKPILQGKEPNDWRTSMYYHYYEFGPPHWVKPNYGIRTERYKLINYYMDNQWELFDLEKDPDEMESLFNWGKVEPDYEKVAASLVKQLKSLRSKYKDNTGKPVSIRLTKMYD